MEENISTLLQQKDALKLIGVLGAAGYETRIVGGCVRDALLDRLVYWVSGFDIDLATTATPEQMLAVFAQNEIRAIPTGIEHGTITAVVFLRNYEVTTLRNDVTTDGRHAEVDFTTDWEADAHRRDFTINAISVDANGKVYDYCGGLEDLNNKRLRFIDDAEKRIREDYLRLLRYFRFLSVLDWEADAEIIAICKTLAPQLKQLSRERVQAEMHKLLTGDGCLRVVKIMLENNILQNLSGLEPDFATFERTVELETIYGEINAFRRLMALAGTEPSALEKLIVLTRDHKKQLQQLALLQDEDLNDLKRILYFYGRGTVLDFYYLHPTDWDIAAIRNWNSPVFPLKAEHIMNMTNGSGPLVGKVMKQAELWWIEHDFAPDLGQIQAYCRTILP